MSRPEIDALMRANEDLVAENARLTDHNRHMIESWELAEQAMAAVSRVRELHLRCECDGDTAGHCDNDAEPWPCATRRALDGEQ